MMSACNTYKIIELIRCYRNSCYVSVGECLCVQFRHVTSSKSVGGLHLGQHCPGANTLSSSLHSKLGQVTVDSQVQRPFCEVEMEMINENED